MNPQFSFILLNFNSILPFVISFVIVLKVAIFFKYKTNQWRLSNIIYFNYKHILTLKTSDKPNVKIIENSLTYYLVFLVVINFMLTYYLNR